jgi:hypothetical protein
MTVRCSSTLIVFISVPMQCPYSFLSLQKNVILSTWDSTTDADKWAWRCVKLSCRGPVGARPLLQLFLRASALPLSPRVFNSLLARWCSDN